MTPKDIRNHVAASCGMSTEERARRNKFAEEIAIALHTETPKQQGEPTSFSAWLEANGDSIEMPLDRVESATKWFDEKEARNERS